MVLTEGGVAAWGHRQVHKWLTSAIRSCVSYTRVEFQNKKYLIFYFIPK
jgi:hypothetical protein